MPEKIVKLFQNKALVKEYGLVLDIKFLIF